MVYRPLSARSTNSAAAIEIQTDIAAGLDRATRSLAAAQSQRVIVLFTDGQPTLPHGPVKKRENVLAVFDAADRAARAGIRIHSFAIGADALEGPLAAVEMATRTGGSFTAVPNAGALPKLMSDVRFASLRNVTLRNETTGAEADLLRVAADGSWIGFLPMKPGTNRIEALVRADGGAEASHRLVIRLDPTRSPPVLLPRYVVQQNELLEICLERRQRLRVTLEERVRKELRIEIERVRTEARKRAATQRKELRLEVEDGIPAGSSFAPRPRNRGRRRWSIT